jgi:O-antigen/teichoic acid export membrane protein
MGFDKINLLNIINISLKTLASNKTSLIYVFITLGTTGMRFVKGFVLMRYLSLNDLGIITLVSATMGLFSMLQLGLLNGGYRIISESIQKRKIVTNIIYTYFLILEVIIILTIIALYLANFLSKTQLLYSFLASFFGILLVMNNWIRNILIAQKRVSEVNKLEVSSTTISLLFLFTVPLWGLYGALCVTFSIEFLFYLFAIYRNRDYLPSKLNFQLKEYKWILSFGFLPFLAGIISSYNMQVETWSIAAFLTTEALGAFYLPKLYIQLFLLIPNAINKLFFPGAIKAYTDRSVGQLKRIIRNYILINTAVSIIMLIITILLIKVVISFFIPIHIIGIHYVWMILPGLMVYTLLLPINLLFYASVILKPFLWTSIIGVIFTTLSLLLAGFLGYLTLDYIAIIKGLFYVTVSLSMFSFYLRKRRLIWLG